MNKTKVLYINACVRPDSRTDRLCRAVLGKIGEPYDEVKLWETGMEALNNALLEKRTALIEAGHYEDPMFDPARQFAQADVIVIGAPYWDGSFPAVLKVYLENIYITGLTSRYNEEGIPVGLCKAEKLYYVTTAGGPYMPDFSYDYVRALATGCFGIKDTVLVKAEMLDVIGFDADKIIERTIAEILSGE